MLHLQHLLSLAKTLLCHNRKYHHRKWAQNLLVQRLFFWQLDFNHIMVKWLHTLHSVGWNCLFIPKLYFLCWNYSLYPPNEVGGGVYWIHLVRPSVRLSVCPSVCRRHGFRSISQVCFGISISNFICMLMVAIGRSLLIFSVVTFKMAAWWPYWIFWFPDSNFSLALNIKFKLQGHNTYVYG